MELPTNGFLEKLNDRSKQIGLWSGLCSNTSAEIMRHAGFDWVVLDMEHSPNSLQTIIQQLQVFEASSTQAIVRVPVNEPVMVKRLLDAGAQSIVFPMVQSVEEAKAAVAATRYPPEGIRGVSGMTRATQYGRTPGYYDKAAGEIAVIAQIETQAAMEIAHEIGVVEGISALFFGPADISADMGLKGNPNEPAVWEAIRPLARDLRDAGIRIGTLMLNPEFAAELLREEFDFVGGGIDTALLARAADGLVATMRDGLDG